MSVRHANLQYPYIRPCPPKKIPTLFCYSKLFFLLLDDQFRHTECFSTIFEKKKNSETQRNFVIGPLSLLIELMMFGCSLIIFETSRFSPLLSLLIELMMFGCSLIIIETSRFSSPLSLLIELMMFGCSLIIIETSRFSPPLSLLIIWVLK